MEKTKMMNRRSLLKALGLAPVVATVAAVASLEDADDGELAAPLPRIRGDLVVSGSLDARRFIQIEARDETLGFWDSQPV